MSDRDEYTLKVAFVAGVIVVGYCFCFAMCRCIYSIHKRISRRSNITTPERVVNQIYTTHNDDVLTTADQAIANNLQTIYNGASNQVIYPQSQHEDFSEDILPPSYDSVIADDNSNVWLTDFSQRWHPSPKVCSTLKAVKLLFRKMKWFHVYYYKFLNHVISYMYNSSVVFQWTISLFFTFH